MKYTLENTAVMFIGWMLATFLTVAYGKASNIRDNVNDKVRGGRDWFRTCYDNVRWQVAR